MLASEWGVSENNRRAKYYRLTRKGEKRLREQTDTWNRVAAAIATVLGARPEEV
jgi:DNA-binding PadR family transcriptional regulator